MQTYRDPSQVIHCAVGELFSVELEGNPTTGYTWQPQLSRACVQLIDRQVRVGGPGLGAGGHEVFFLRAGEPGVAEVRFSKRRSWGGEVGATKRFQVVVE